MPKEAIKDLIKFLTPFPDEVKQTALWLREFVWDLYPKSNELIYDNYNALAFGFAVSDKAGDVFCSVAVYGKHVNFGFNRGSEIADQEKKLNGKGSLYRSIKVTDVKHFPKGYIIELMEEAYVNALARLEGHEQTITGQTITKSISPKKRRPIQNAA